MKPDKNDKLDELLFEALTREKPAFDFDKWKKNHPKEINIFESQTESGHIMKPVGFFRAIMKSSITKFATAAGVMICATGLFIGVFHNGATPAWAIEQTVAAMQSIRTMEISGDLWPWSSDSVPFKFWLKLADDGSKLFEMRFETAKQIVVVRGDKAWVYSHDENVVKIFDNIKNSHEMTRDMTFCYQMAELSPWITGKMLETLKLFSRDWQEFQSKDPNTGRKYITVKCSYIPLSMSFWFTCDMESKLIIDGLQWQSADFAGVPNMHATSFKYNQEIDSDIFNFQIPEGVKVMNAQKLQEADNGLDTKVK